MRVAANVRLYRQTRRLTLEELSERLGSVTGTAISAAALLRVEQGKRGVEAGDLVALALTLKVAVADLLVPGSDEATPAGGPAGAGDDVAVSAGKAVARADYLDVIGLGAPAVPGTDATTEAVIVPVEQMEAIASAFAAVGAAAGEAARQFTLVTSNAATLATIAAGGHPRAAHGSSMRLLRQAGYTTEQLRDRFGPDAAFS